MKTQREVERLLEAAIGQIVSDAGFKKERRCKFIRRFPGGFQEVFIGVWSWPPVFEFAVGFAIRLDVVQDICRPFSHIAPDFQAQTQTSLIQMDRFLPDKTMDHFLPDKKRFRVLSEDDIQRSLEILEPVIREKAIPFLDTHKDVISLDRAINYEGMDKSSLPERALISVILAHLADNPNFESIVADFEKQMKPLIPRYRDAFKNLVDYLRQQRAQCSDYPRLGTA